MNMCKKMVAFIAIFSLALALFSVTPYTASAASKTKITKCSVMIKKKKYIYTGKKIKPAITVKYKGKKLKLNKQYKVSYKNNKNVGTAMVLVKGKGRYSGTKKLRFTIAPKTIKAAQITLGSYQKTYNGTKITPPVTAVSVDGVTLSAKTDYTVSYGNDYTTGKGVVVVKGKGNYTGTAKVTFDFEIANDVFTIKAKSDNSYESSLTEGTSFQFGQEAASVLGAVGLEKTNGTEFNHPNGMAYTTIDETVYYVVADTWNNRVLVYKGASAAKAISGNPCNVLGQTSFDTNTPGKELDNLNWPMSVAIDAQNRLYVADTGNHRILIYDSITDLQDGKEADHAIEWFDSNHESHNNHISWPYAISTDCEGKLIVTNTLGGKLLIWDSIPDDWEGEHNPSTIISYGESATPRTITYTGSQLLIGDENIENVGSGYYVYNNFPDSSLAAYDFIFPTENGYSEGAMINGKLYMYTDKLYVYNDGRIDNENDTGDIVLMAEKEPYTKTGKYFLEAGGTSRFLNLDGALYMSLYNRNAIVGWKDPANELTGTTIPKPDVYIGTSGYEEDTTHLASDYLMHNPIPVTDGEHLVIADDLEQSLYVYKKIPTSSGALPDFTYEANHEIGDILLYTDADDKTTMVVTFRTKNQIYIWNDYQFDGSQPDICLDGKIGSKTYSLGTTGEMTYVEYDGTYFYLCSATQGGYVINVYQGIPNENSEIIGQITGITASTGMGDISSNGTNIAVIYDTKTACVFQASQLAQATTQEPVTLTAEDAIGTIDTVHVEGSDDEHNSDHNKWVINEYNSAERTTFGSLQSVLLTCDGKVIASDMSENRVIIWDNITDATTNKESSTPVILGHGPNSYELDDLCEGTFAYHDKIEAIYADTLFMPRYLAYDKSNLWVGEFKFSNRLLRYEMQ